MAFIIGNQIKFSESLFVYIKEISYQFIAVCLGAVMVFIVWAILTYRDKALLEELNGYKRLLQECLDEIPDRSFKLDKY